MLQKIFNLCCQEAKGENLSIVQKTIDQVSGKKKKELEKMKELRLKYSFGTHTSPFYFDPVTGLQRSKANFEHHQKIDNMRENATVKAIIDNVSLCSD